jgi:hypothetical protein
LTAGLGVPVGLDRAAALEVGEREDVAELGARRRTESVKALVEPALELIRSHRPETSGAVVERGLWTALDKSSLHLREVRIPDRRRCRG